MQQRGESISYYHPRTRKSSDFSYECLGAPCRYSGWLYLKIAKAWAIPPKKLANIERFKDPDNKGYIDINITNAEPRGRNFEIAKMGANKKKDHSHHMGWTLCWRGPERDLKLWCRVFEYRIQVHCRAKSGKDQKVHYGQVVACSMLEAYITCNASFPPIWAPSVIKSKQPFTPMKDI